LKVSGSPRFFSENLEKGKGVHRSGTLLYVVGRSNNTPLSCPEVLKRKYYFLKGHRLPELSEISAGDFTKK
jgi:hypothetical protein